MSNTKVLSIDGSPIQVNGKYVTIADTNLQDKVITPTAEPQVIMADEQYIGLNSVMIMSDDALIPENIKEGTSIFGVTGTYEQQAFAAIGVTYPAGSAVTCTNGTKTLAAKNTSGQWVFAIPETGTWIVTATDGTNSKSQSVEITDEGQFESMELKYIFMLIENGIEEQTFTNDSASVSLLSDGVLMIGCSTPKAYGATGFYYTEVDVTNYSSLCFKGYYSDYNNGYAWNSVLRSGVQIGTSYSESAAKYTFTSATEGDYSIDISALSGIYYISICGVSMSTDTAGTKSVRACIRDMWLE